MVGALGRDTILVWDWNLKALRPRPEADYRLSDFEFAKTVLMSGCWVSYRMNSIAEAASRLVDKAGWRRQVESPALNLGPGN